jgi:hypothetical protein
MEKELTIFTNNSSLMAWKSKHKAYEGKYELMVSTGGDYPEQQSIVLDQKDLQALRNWIDSELTSN